MIERRARVLAVESGILILEPDAAPCLGCTIGCGGRCNLFTTAADGRMRLAVPPGMDLGPGDTVSLEVDEDRLRRAAWQGYGVALLALLAGAAAGYLCGSALPAWGLNIDPDIPTLIGMGAGLTWALARTRRGEFAPRVRPLAASAESIPSSDRL